LSGGPDRPGLPLYGFFLGSDLRFFFWQVKRSGLATATQEQHSREQKKSGDGVAHDDDPNY
jgi:hypothetical protein